MDFNDVAIKNFKGNIRRYISYFLCNSFSVFILFMFSTLMFSKELKNSPQLEKSITKIFVLPCVVLIFFSVFFIAYSYSAFMRGRKKEFGLFMNLGMSIWDIRKLILIENSLIAAGSIAFGIITGTIFFRIFFLIITSLIGITDIAFHITLKSYIYTIVIFAIIFLFAVLSTIVAAGRYEIDILLKSDRVVETNNHSNPITAVAGVVTLVSSLFVLFKWFNGDGGLLLLCTIGFILGLYITISQFGNLILRIAKKKKAMYHNNLILFTNLNYKFKQTKKIIFIISIMTVVVIFINGFYLSLVLSAERIALDNNPFDLAFVQMLKQNNIDDGQINKLIDDSKDIVTDRKAIDFINIDGKTIISQDALNSVVGSQYNVSRGKYIRLIQVNGYSEKEKRDIYKKEMQFPDQGILSSYSNQEYIFKILFNNLGYQFTYCIILNNLDYDSIKSGNSDAEIGKLQLLNFKDWKETQPLVNRLEDIFKTSTKDSDNYLSMVSSKIGTYNENKQGTKVLFYLLSFLGVFFFIATSIILFLRLFSELDNEISKYRKLNKIGITEDEIRRSIGREFLALFFTGPIIGIPTAIIYTLAFGRDNQSIMPQIISCNLIISSVFIAFEVVYYHISKNFYCKRIIESL